MRRLILECIQNKAKQSKINIKSTLAARDNAQNGSAPDFYSLQRE